MSKKEFKLDYSETKTELHLLYVKWAIKHLTAIDNFLERLSWFSNINMVDVASAIIKEREKLCNENKAYFDADDMIKTIQKENAKTKFNCKNEGD